MGIFLRLLALGFIMAGLSHVALGPAADRLLGAVITGDAGLDSQNRFYGAAFTLYGLIFWVAASDVERHTVMLRLALVAFFLGGLARIASIVLMGWPPPMILALLASEIILPPVIFWRLHRVR